jgi:hypothetical protein
MPFKDKARALEYQRAYWKAHPEKQRMKKTRKRGISTKWLKEYKKTLCCSACGENDPVCIDFHHVDRSLKKESVHRMASTGTGITTIKAEIAKCIPLCANCHRKLHANNRMEPLEFESRPPAPHAGILPD